MEAQSVSSHVLPFETLVHIKKCREKIIFLNYFPRDAFLKAFSSDLFFSVPFQLLRLHLMAVLSCPAIPSELSLCFLVGSCSSGAGCGTVMTHAALENLLKQEDSTFRTPLRKILCIRLMFPCSYPTNPKTSGQSVCPYSGILNQMCLFGPMTIQL